MSYLQGQKQPHSIPTQPLTFSHLMQLFAPSTATLSYWLHWRVMVCGIWVVAPIIAAVYMIWKYESLNKVVPRSGRAAKDDDEAWRPCLKQIHPIWLLGYRVVAFALLMGLLVAKLSAGGFFLFYFYTQWTFTLVTIYFGFGTVLSVYGCCRHLNLDNPESNFRHVRTDAEQGNQVPLIVDYGTKTLKVSINQEELYVHQSQSIPCFLFKILFQITAGAVMLTDIVYWCILFPYFTINEYKLNYVTISMHSLNALLLLGDAALNIMPLSWFGISYFVLWTGAYVTFQWTVHAFRSMWWPYPFLDLASPYAPVWYLLMASLHLACYGFFVLVVKLKQDLLSKWFPESHQCPR